MAYKIYFGNSVKKSFQGQESGLRHNVTQNVATSEANDFVPYHALITGKLIGVGNYRTLLYSLSTVTKTDFASKQYEAFVTSFIDGWEWKKFVKRGVQKEYRVRAGQLIELNKGEITPLITLVVNKSHMLNINKEDPDVTKFFIVMSKAFLHESHKNMYLAFKKYLFDKLTDINVIHTESISKLCYKSLAIEPRKPKSIAEAKNMGRDLTIEVMKSLIHT